MSWSELERLVEEAESDRAVGDVLRHCRSRDELVLAAQRLGFRISSEDLRQAWELHRQERRFTPWAEQAGRAGAGG